MISLAEQHGMRDRVSIGSCGTGDWHKGEAADQRMSAVASARGYQLHSKASSFQDQFFKTCHYLLAADHSIQDQLLRRVDSDENKSRIFMMTAFSVRYQNEEVPDPYYGGHHGFEHVMDMLEDSCLGLIQKIQSQTSG